jgi:hypothetical protein
MKVIINILGDHDNVRRLLRNDGWQLQEKIAGSISALHPEVESEQEARFRLHSLGLLTSGSLRVEFPIRRLVGARG